MDARPTLSEVKRRCAYWQRALRLQDWNVSLRFVTSEDIGSDTYADVEITPQKKYASVRMCLPDQWPTRGHQESPEVALVHELLHLHLDAWKTQSAVEENQKEAVIDAIARAIVRDR